MARVVLQEDITKDNLNASPYLRLTRSTPLNLTTQWQTITLDGTSTYNVNIFPVENGKPTVYLDSDNQTMKFNTGGIRRTYQVEFDYKLTGGTVVSNIFFRFYIPSTPAIYFPFPEGDGYANLAKLALAETWRGQYNRRVPLASGMMANGVQLQMRAESVTLTAPRLDDIILFVHGA